MRAIGISDHALVRWLERTGAMDLQPLREQLEESLDRAARAAVVLGVERYLILADGLVYVVQDGTVVTVIDDDGRHGHLLTPRPERDAS
ncbi:MAG: hypothetical protein AB7L36_00660 [Sphingomonadaceae bacterium]